MIKTAFHEILDLRNINAVRIYLSHKCCGCTVPYIVMCMIHVVMILAEWKYGVFRARLKAFFTSEAAEYTFKAA